MSSVCRGVWKHKWLFNKTFIDSACSTQMEQLLLYELWGRVSNPRHLLLDACTAASAVEPSFGFNEKTVRCRSIWRPTWVNKTKRARPRVTGDRRPWAIAIEGHSSHRCLICFARAIRSLVSVAATLCSFSAFVWDFQNSSSGRGPLYQVALA